MLDAVQIPILLKAIDFVFDEGRRILEERRERRKAETSAPTVQPQHAEEKPPAEQEAAPLAPEQAEEIKKDLVASKIDELLWRTHEDEVRSLVRQLEKHTQGYYTLKEQFAEFGSAYVPPHIVSQIRDREELILETRTRLEAVLSKIYKKDISPSG